MIRLKKTSLLRLLGAVPLERKDHEASGPKYFERSALTVT
jgi:hypothetical protein